jgi:hypothetical protein
VTLAEISMKYRALRSELGLQGDNNKIMAYDKILISIDNARSIAEAQFFISEDMKNCTDEERLAIYQQALDDLEQL